LDDHPEQRRVHDQVRVSGLPRDARVQDCRACGAGRIEHLAGHPDHITAGGLRCEEAAVRSPLGDDVVLQVHGNNGRAAGIQVHVVS
jgi:hypothetical protein